MRGWRRHIPIGRMRETPPPGDHASKRNDLSVDGAWKIHIENDSWNDVAVEVEMSSEELTSRILSAFEPGWLEA